VLLPAKRTLVTLAAMKLVSLKPVVGTGEHVVSALAEGGAADAPRLDSVVALAGANLERAEKDLDDIVPAQCMDDRVIVVGGNIEIANVIVAGERACRHMLPRIAARPSAGAFRVLAMPLSRLKQSLRQRTHALQAPPAGQDDSDFLLSRRKAKTLP
jgi:hypothetical protein